MERRDRALKALNELNFLDSLETCDKPDAIKRWAENFSIFGDKLFDGLNSDELSRASELMFRNINFLKHHTAELKNALDESQKIKKFFS